MVQACNREDPYVAAANTHGDSLFSPSSHWKLDSHDGPVKSRRSNGEGIRAEFANVAAEITITNCTKFILLMVIEVEKAHKSVDRRDDSGCHWQGEKKTCMRWVT
ncbi:hypothetical protein H2248_000194 [Termitomyces sp. 'cryptogamus']|nr:hypothetical protein H2248_000194 [Termitomyces sp. 'cryptogamus']